MMMQSQLTFQKMPVKKMAFAKPKRGAWKVERRKQRKFKYNQRSMEYYGRH